RVDCSLLLTLLSRPRPTLFPYTTLFRSDGEESNPHLKGVIGYGADLVCVSENRQFPLLRATSLGVRSSSLPGASTVTSVTVPELDRKSTRLNSSHVAISYAVFCLKKKKH